MYTKYDTNSNILIFLKTYKVFLENSRHNRWMREKAEGLMNNKDIAEYVIKTQKDEENAFDELYKQIWSTVYYYCYKQLGSEEDAKDALQTVFLQVHKKIKTLKNPYAFNSFLCKIMHDICCDFLRSGHFDNTEFTDEQEFMPESNAEFLPEEAYEREEIRSTIGKFVENLPEKQREAILHFYYNDLSLKEIAQVTNSGEKAVISRLVLGRKSLRKAVDELIQKGALNVMTTMPVPILTKILLEETPSIARPEVGAEVWQKIGVSIGAIAAGTSVGAASSGITATASGAAAGVLPNVVISAVVIAAIGGAAFLGVQIKNDVLSDKPAQITQEIEQTQTSEHDLIAIIKTLKTQAEVDVFVNTYNFYTLGVNKASGAGEYTVYYTTQKGSRIYLGGRQTEQGQFIIAHESVDENAQLLQTQEIPSWFRQAEK